MERVSVMGKIHFVGHDLLCLCGQPYKQRGLFAGAGDLLGKPTTDPVTCPWCARLWNQVKNAPWNEIDESIAERAIYNAVKPEEECEV